MAAPDLDAYFARIGYDSPHAPTFEVLAGIHAAHARAIPFENLDVLLGRGISLDLAAIERKLVREKRGGYCFEHNGLFLAVLRALGFRVTPLIARVRWQVPAGKPTPLTHMILRVDLDGRPWLADTGFGGIGLISPLALDTDAEQGDAHEPRRLVRQGHHLVHQFRTGGEWNDVYIFTLDEATPVDFEVGNWFTSTHPNSRFRQSLIAALAGPDRRFTLLNRDFTTRFRDGRIEKREIASADELLAVLAEVFGLRFPPGTRFGPPGSPWPS
ncbi:MAG TPA: arylamine N-acetyltransferase [Opitutus sp.]|nr:arylamine N-acetyltransferase [Opitutus sp.]